MKELLESGVKISEKEPLSKHTTIGIGGPADYYAEIHTLKQLHAVTQAARARNQLVR